MPNPIAVEMLKYIIRMTERANKPIDLSEKSMLDVITAHSQQRVCELIRSNLFYAFENHYDYKKEEVLELARRVPELAAYLRIRSAYSYNSKNKFTLEEINSLPKDKGEQ